MNYPGMRFDILEIFRDAQGAMSDQIAAIWASRQARDAAISRDQQREVYRRQLWASKSAKSGVSQCPLCGGVLEHREGNPRPIHLGICSL
jgi:hypothetical protein